MIATMPFTWRIQLVQDRSSHIVRFKLQIQMHTGQTIRADHIKAKKFQLPVIGDDNVQLALQSHLVMVRARFSCNWRNDEL